MKREFWTVTWKENGSYMEQTCPNNDWAWALVDVLRLRGHVVTLQMVKP